MRGPALPPGVGVLVVGHGTADPVGAGETSQVAASVAAFLPGVAVELGFLEVIGPSIGEATARLVARGCREVVVAPLLLFAAGHAKRDVPEAVAVAAAAAGLPVVQSAAFGCHSDIVALSATRRRQSTARLADIAAADTLLLMVGRGSSDPAAVSQLREFTEATIASDPAPRPARVELGFVAAARPRLDEAIRAAADPAGGLPRRILVHPHLLFSGHVEEQVAEAVEAGRRMRPEVEWVQVARLGADPLVARALASRIVEVAGPESLSRQGCVHSSQ
ncbi:MAG: sirohydrochlorin chelatase [Pirellulales bacterium]